MAWDQLDINKPHLVYIILGGFTSLFMLCSSVIKEKLYIGEATVATLCGIIFGPHAANLIDPGTWGNTDQITLEFARIVLVVQCFAVGVELPKSYMERHWRSVVLLLVPVMTFGWLVTSLFVWGIIPDVNWLDSLCIAACVTATDPVLASSVVGKGKFAKRVPKHLRDLLSAESGCNDGMAFPFIYLALYIIRYKHHPDEVALHWFCNVVLYECVFGAFYGVCVGYIARRAIRAAHERDLIDRESFLVFYFVLALFCAGSGSLLGMDDLLIGFACGVGFSNDGWFTEKTEETHVSNVIDLLINLAFFVYFGTIIPWEQYNADIFGLKAWRLVVIGILVLLFRRIPIMLALKPVIPDVKTWREALFAGHFGPIGVGAIFVAILARAELETGTTMPTEDLPAADFPHDNIIELIWPVTSFLVICSILVHGSSIAVFTLGKHINTLTLTMSYTKANDDTTWMDRLPRIQSRSKTSMSMRRPDDTESSLDDKMEFGTGGLKPGNFLRRQREEDPPSRSSSRQAGQRRKQWDSGRGPGGPISQSAIAPRRAAAESAPPFSRGDSDTLAMKNEESPESSLEKKPSSPSSDAPDEPEAEVYEEGDNTVYEDEEGNVLEVEAAQEGATDAQRQRHEENEARKLMSDEDVHHGVSSKAHAQEHHLEKQPAKHAEHHSEKQPAKHAEHLGEETDGAAEPAPRRSALKRMGTWSGALHRREGREEPGKEHKTKAEPMRGPARAYQFGNTIIVEDEDGEVIKKYDIPSTPKKKKESGEPSFTDPLKTRQRLHRMGTHLGLHHTENPVDAGSPSEAGNKSVASPKKPGLDDDDERVRFTVTTGGRRMSKLEFIQQIRQLDPRVRAQVVEESDAPEAVKREARADAHEHETKQRAQEWDFEPRSRNVHPGELGSPQEDMARIHKLASNESGHRGPEGLTLIDSNNEEIPFHNITDDLHKHSAEASTGRETAAQRRRREARLRAQQTSPTAEDSDDDGTERVPPRPTAGSERAPPSDSIERETAAERRRRLGALGVSKDESDSDEDETQPREPPTKPGIRFAEEPTREQQSTMNRRGRWKNK